MSKLDEAFLKAYAKVRGTGHESVTDAPQASEHTNSVANKERTAADSLSPHETTQQDPFTRVDSDDDMSQLLRLEEGVVNVASFIARTGNGRTRGTAQRPQGGVADDLPPVRPHVPESHSQPSSGDETIRVIDTSHSLQGPHFQPISLDLAALDIFAPAVAVATAPPSRAALVEASVYQNIAAPDYTQFDTIVRTRTEQPARASSASVIETTPRDTTGPTRQSPRDDFDKRDFDKRPGSSNDDRFGGASSSSTAPTAPTAPTERGRLLPGSADNRLFLRTDEAHEVQPADDTTEAVDQTAEQYADEQYADEQHADEVQQQFEAKSVQLQHEQTQHEQTEQPTLTRADFLAAWEVDRFEFEDIIWDLSAENSPLWAAVEQLEIACREGLQVLAITSPSRGQGRSTLSITLARMLAATGLNVALLDGDIDRPSLADKLCLEIRLGWGDAVRTGLSVEEVAVQSVEDGFTVLPSAPPDSAKALRPAAETTGAMIDTLRNAFDLIIIDTANVNVIGGWIPGAEDGRIDAALVIQDVRHNDPEAMQACLRRLQKIGINNIGLVENFASA